MITAGKKCPEFFAMQWVTWYYGLFDGGLFLLRARRSSLLPPTPQPPALFTTTLMTQGMLLPAVLASLKGRRDLDFRLSLSC